MTTNEATSGSIVHVELYSDDVEATRAFYEDAFDWTVESVEGMEGVAEMEYLVWRTADPPFGGLVGEMPDPAFEPPTTLFYVDVEDLAASGEAVEAAGGEILVADLPVPGMGAFTVFRDPGGVVEALWETRAEGSEMEGEEMPTYTDEPGPGSICFFELYTEDPEATRTFHEAVFGWSFEAAEGSDYTIIEPPTPPNGGVMAATEAMPAGTLPYLLVERAEDACRTIEAAGGSVLREPYEVEGWGTMAVFEAPGGVVQAVWENAPAAERDEGAGTGRAEPATD